MRSPRRRDRFWMVTFADESPHVYDELPVYFPTKREAVAHREFLEANRNDFYGDTPLAVRVSDEPWDAIAWPWLDGSQW